MNIELMEHQEEGANWIAANCGRDLLLHWDQGIGKTYAAIVGGDRLGAINILVICPAVGRRNWKREVAACQTMDRPITVVEKRADLPDDPEGVVIVS